MSVETYELDWKPKASLALITIAVMLATFVEVLNTSIANVALKYMAGSFSVSNDESLWIVTIFLIACSILLPATVSHCHVFSIVLTLILPWMEEIIDCLPSILFLLVPSFQN